MAEPSNIKYLKRFIACPSSENWEEVKIHAVRDCYFGSECPLININNGCCPLLTSVPSENYPTSDDLPKLTVIAIQYLALLESRGTKNY